MRSSHPPGLLQHHPRQSEDPNDCSERQHRMGQARETDILKAQLGDETGWPVRVQETDFVCPILNPHIKVNLKHFSSNLPSS